jgi:hypothetical protein
MKKEDFALLLKDLYTLYNPSFLDNIPMLVERYSRMEVDAVRTALIKYNRKNASFYDPNKDKDEYAINLVNEYSKGNRVLYGVKLEDFKTEEKEKFLVDADKIKDDVNEQIAKIQNELSNKENKLSTEYEKKIKEVVDKIESLKTKKTIYDSVDVRLIVNYTEHELKLPNKEIILSLGVGSRLITTSTDGSKIIALKIVDVMCDGVSDPDGKLIIEIILDRE